MDQQTLIFDHMEIAERIGLKYANRNSRHPDECVAECYYLLCELFLGGDYKMYLAKPEIRTVAVYVKSRLVNYFERMARRGPDPLIEDKVTRNTDQEMVEYLSEVLGDDDKAFQVFHYLKGGLALSEIALIEPGLRKMVGKMTREVSARIRRLESLQALGQPIPREIKFDPSLVPLEDIPVGQDIDSDNAGQG